MVLIIVILVKLIGLVPDETANANLHPPPTGDVSQASWTNFWCAGDLGVHMSRDIQPGEVFTYLTVVREAPKSIYGIRHFECVCKCGAVKTVSKYNLLDGKTLSCGCYNRELTRERNTVHGKSKTREFHVWSSMIGRCSNPKLPGYERYGGRGITVCERWRGSFQSFLDDMGPRPARHTIERKDNNGNYEPSNCRWATRAEQSVNRRDNRLIAYRGETHPVSVWARQFGIHYSTITARLNQGRSLDEVFSTSRVPYPTKKAANL